jgi:hypothetical protein
MSLLSDCGTFICHLLFFCDAMCGDVTQTARCFTYCHVWGCNTDCAVFHGLHTPSESLVFPSFLSEYFMSPVVLIYTSPNMELGVSHTVTTKTDDGGCLTTEWRGKHFDSGVMTGQEAGENCTVRSSIICALHQLLL